MKRASKILVVWLASACSLFAVAPVVVPLGSINDGLIAPSRVAIDSSGNLLVADASTGQITVFDVFGRTVAMHTNFATPLALAVDASGKIYVGEGGNGSVSMFDSGWNFLGKLGAGDGEFAMPNFIAIDPTPGSNTVFVSDSATNLVRVYYNGNFAFSFGGFGTGDGQFDFPAGILATMNELFVVDQGNGRMQVFDHAGNYLRQFNISKGSGSLGAITGRCHGMTMDTTNRLYVTDSFQDNARVLDTNGLSLGLIGSFGDGPGQLRSPLALALDGLNRLFIASPNNGRVEIFGIDSFVHLSCSSPDGLLATGTNLIFTVITSGPGPFAYQWLRNGTNLVDGGSISGATNATVNIAPLGPGDAGAYSLRMIGPGGTNLWNAAPFVVMTPPSISGQPSAQTVALGSAASFSVTAAGDALSFQWYFNGEAIGGATNASLQIAGAKSADAGDYAVSVFNSVGSVLSDPATLTVIAPPVIVLHPCDRRAVQGTTALFDVVAEGDQLAFAWRYNGAPAFAPNAPAMVLPDVQPPAEGEYSVVVTNLAGAVTSSVASLSVLIPPSTQRVDSVSLQDNIGMIIQFSADPGLRYALDASPDLTSWSSLTNFISPPSPFTFLDTDATNIPLRFYRLRWRP